MGIPTAIAAVQSNLKVQFAIYRNSYKLLVTENYNRRLLEGYKCREKDNIKMYITQIEWHVNWFTGSSGCDGLFSAEHTVANILGSS
jgi:transposase-like protein